MANDDVEAVIRACEYEEESIDEMLAQYNQDSFFEIIEFYESRGIYVSEPMVNRYVKDSVTDVMTPQEIEERLNLPKDSVNRDLILGKFDEWKKRGYVRKSGTSWLIHSSVPMHVYKGMNRRSLSAELIKRIREDEDAMQFINNFISYADEVIERDTDEKLFYFKFEDPTVDIGGASYEIMFSPTEQAFFKRYTPINKKFQSISNHKLKQFVMNQKNAINYVLERKFG